MIRKFPDQIYACLSNSSKTGVTVLLGHANQPVSGWQPYLIATPAREVVGDLVDALERIAEAADHYGNEADAENKGAETLAYAHKSTCNLARATLAKIKGEADD